MQSTQLLQEVTKHVKAVQEIALQQLLPLDNAQLNHKPAPNKWSAAECLEHLNRYARYYNPAIEQAIQHSLEKQWLAKNTFKSTWLGKKSIAVVHPDNARASKTMKHMNPAQSVIKSTVVQEFIDHQTKLLTLVEAAEQVDLNKARIPIEFMKLLKLKLGDTLLFIDAHQCRHCNQALRAITNV